VATTIQNAAGSRSQGLEFSANWRPAELLSFDATLAYIDSIYTDFHNAPCNSIDNSLAELGLTAPGATTAGGACLYRDLSGDTRPFAPKYSGTLSMSYGVYLGGQNVLKLEPTVNVTSKFYTMDDLDPVSLQSGYAKIDVRLAYGPQNGRWSVAFVGRNLADKWTSQFINAASFANGSGVALPDPSRTFGVQVQVRN
jgi:outer membrane receptor protein involved in Fe transport